MDRTLFPPWLRRAALALLLLGAHPAPARAACGLTEAATAAAALPGDPTLAQLIADSLAHRPELAAAAARTRALCERVPQAGALPDPMLELGVQNDGFTSLEVGAMETSFVSIMASQSLPWPGKRALRSELAELAAQGSRYPSARLRLSTVAEVERAYLGLSLGKDRLELLDRLDDLWGKAAAVARARYEAGDGAQSDLLRAQLELNRNKQRRSALLGQVRGQRQALNRLRGRPLAEEIEPALHLRAQGAPPPLEREAELARAEEHSPELAAARLELQLAQRTVSLAEKAALPDFSVRAGLMVRGTALPPMWLLTVGAPLPLFAGDKQDRQVAEGRFSAQSQAHAVQALEELLRLRVEERESELAALAESIRLYQAGLLVQSAATAESTLAQYQVGKVGFAAVLEASAGYIADEDGYLQALAGAYLLRIAAAELSLDPVPGASGGAMGSLSAGGAMGGGSVMKSGGGRAAAGAAAPESEPASSGM